MVIGNQPVALINQIGSFEIHMRIAVLKQLDPKIAVLNLILFAIAGQITQCISPFGGHALTIQKMKNPV